MTSLDDAQGVMLKGGGVKRCRDGRGGQLVGGKWVGEKAVTHLPLIII